MAGIVTVWEHLGNHQRTNFVALFISISSSIAIRILAQSHIACNVFMSTQTFDFCFVGHLNSTPPHRRPQSRKRCPLAIAPLTFRHVWWIAKYHVNREVLWVVVAIRQYRSRR